jgi:hypothetical protein
LYLRETFLRTGFCFFRLANIALSSYVVGSLEYQTGNTKITLYVATGNRLEWTKFHTYWSNGFIQSVKVLKIQGKFRAHLVLEES